MVLRPPVEPMLAQARGTLPPLAGVPGGMAVQPKFDGFRALLYTPLHAGDPVLLQTRRGALVQDRFPDLTAAARSLPNGLVLDGELAVLNHHGQLSFTALQRRATAGRNARALAAELPAHFIAFDVLQSDGQELLNEPFARRREIMETLFADHRLGPPWTLCPSTTDPAIADEWLHEWTDVPGIEGVVAKSLTGRYRPGVRGWTKIRRRNSTEALIGAITSSLHRSQVLLLGRYDTTGRLRLVGKTATLKPGPARDIAGHLTAAGPDHPWTGVRFTASWTSRTPLEPVLVAPVLVAEISADVSQDHGVWRHPCATNGSAGTPPKPTSRRSARRSERFHRASGQLLPGQGPPGLPREHLSPCQPSSRTATMRAYQSSDQPELPAVITPRHALISTALLAACLTACNPAATTAPDDKPASPAASAPSAAAPGAPAGGSGTPFSDAIASLPTGEESRTG